MNIVMTCGGTGGHIYPAIAIADKIREHHEDANIAFIGTGRPLEHEVIPQSGYELFTVAAKGFNRKELLKNFGAIKDTLKGRRQAKKILKELMPQAVIGTGGYVTVPVITAAKSLGIPCFIHEQNAVPGLSNMFLERYCKRVFLGFQEASAFFKDLEKCIVTGNPIRKNICALSKKEAREKLNIGRKDKVLLVFGGSQGAGMLNKLVIDILPLLLSKKGVKVIVITGSYYYKAVESDLKEKGILDNKDLSLIAYTEDIGHYLSACDMALSRAGALTVSEEAACSVPSILIPSPNVTGNHQFFNGKSFSDKGGAILLNEDGLTEEYLLKEIEDLLQDDEKREKMSKAMKESFVADSAYTIFKNLGLRE